MQGLHGAHPNCGMNLADELQRRHPFTMDILNIRTENILAHSAAFVGISALALLYNVPLSSTDEAAYISSGSTEMITGKEADHGVITSKALTQHHMPNNRQFAEGNSTSIQNKEATQSKPLSFESPN